VSVRTADGRQAILPDAFTVDPSAPPALDAGAGKPEADAGTVGNPRPGADGGPPDTSASPALPFACPQPVDADAVAFHRFEGSLDDATGNHPARALGTPRFVAGEAPCGQALALDGSYHLEIDDAPDFTLSAGSLDFWYRATTHPDDNPLGLLSRDEDGEAGPGQLTLYHAGGGSGRLLVRMQDPSELYRCSDAPLPLYRWVHVALNFGPPGVELYVDGQLQTASDVLPFYTAQVRCGATGEHGLGDNGNPWVVGASADVSSPGRSTPVRSFATDAAINELRISRVRRTFAP
jgi:hypothetical protein